MSGWNELHMPEEEEEEGGGGGGRRRRRRWGEGCEWQILKVSVIAREAGNPGTRPEATTRCQ